MEGTIAWHSPTTENPALGSTEIREVWNAMGDGYPVHLHLVHFDILERRLIVWVGKNNQCRSVASGLYIYRIKAGKYTKSLKMNLIR